MRLLIFKTVLALLALAFATLFAIIVLPPLLASGDVLGALAAGFVNPYATGYSLDVILCWCILAVWVWYEAVEKKIKHGWLCLLLGLFPGVATGFAVYLLLRYHQLAKRAVV